MTMDKITRKLIQAVFVIGAVGFFTGSVFADENMKLMIMGIGQMVVSIGIAVVFYMIPDYKGKNDKDRTT